MSAVLHDAADEAAAEWFARLRDEDVTEQDHAEFRAWLDSDARHATAWSEMQRMWSGMDALTPVTAEPSRTAAHPGAVRAAGSDAVRQPAARAQSSRAENPRDANVRTGNARAVKLPPRMRFTRQFASIPATAAPPSWVRRRAPKLRLVSRSVAAGVACVVLMAATWLAVPTSYLVPGADYRTGVGELRTVSLPDGSSVDLAAGSALTLRFTAEERRVVLVAGRAFFQVAHDIRRPFIVGAGEGEVRAVGTAFDVDVAAGLVDVGVSEGHVHVLTRGALHTELIAGQSVRYGAGLGTVEPRSPADVAAWRDHRLVFENAPLSEVLADLQRYRRGRIIVADAALSKRPVTGVFDTRDAEAALETVTQLIPARVIDVFGALTLILPASD